MGVSLVDVCSVSSSLLDFDLKSGFLKNIVKYVYDMSHCRLAASFL